MRLSAAFRSDNVEGFVRLMESDFGMRAEWRSEREIVLRRAQ
jgi:transmembrane sensor